MRCIKLIFCFFLLLLFLTCCEKKDSRKKIYTIARDPYFYPADLSGKNDNVLAFIDDLLFQISLEEEIKIQIVNVGWNNQLFNLKKNKYDGVISSYIPDVFSKETYAFSDLFLGIGDVLVVKNDSEIESIDSMQGKTIGIRKDSLAIFNLEKFSNMYMKTYINSACALEMLVKGSLDGVVMNILEAYAFTTNIYYDQLKVIASPLTSEGLRMIVMRNKNLGLISFVNVGLKKLKGNGKYDFLLTKWDLDQ